MPDLSEVQSFIDASRQVNTARELETLIADVTREMGFDYFALIHHVDLSPLSADLAHMDQGDLIGLTNYPKEWVEIYQRRNIVANDPILLASHQTNVGFAWDDIGDLINVTAQHREITSDTRRAGIGNGFTVPAHVPGEANGSCNFAVRTGRELPKKNLPTAHLIGAFAFQAARNIVGKGQRGPAASKRAKLSNRQLECIALVARGKSDWEIGKILGISQLTVKRHMLLAREQLNVTKRIQIAMRALFDGQIALSDVVK